MNVLVKKPNPSINDLQTLRKFGASSEKSASQIERFNEAELAVVIDEAMSELTILPAPPIVKNSARKPLPAALPVYN